MNCRTFPTKDVPTQGVVLRRTQQQQQQQSTTTPETTQPEPEEAQPSEPPAVRTGSAVMYIDFSSGKSPCIALCNSACTL